MHHRLVPGNQLSSYQPYGFTLIELLAVITIILAVSVVALPSIVSVLASHQVDSAAQVLQGAIVGARDAAVHANASAGLRLVHDPALAGALTSIVQTRRPADYSVGMASIYPGTDYSALTALPCLVLEESPGQWKEVGGKWALLPNEPASWWDNLRLGERLSIGGQDYTICGPAFQATPEGTTNVNPALAPLTRTLVAPDGMTTYGPVQVQHLFLTNNRDDNLDGFPDNGWDGVDNDNDKVIDNAAEWEAESWHLPRINTVNLPYHVTRRPVPSGQVVSLGTGVIDLARSRLPLNAMSGDVDLIVDQTGHVVSSLPYGVPSSLRLDSAFFHFWLGDRSDLGFPGVPKSPARLLTIFGRTGKAGIIDPGGQGNDPYQLAQQGSQ